VGSQQDNTMQQACQYIQLREPTYVLPLVGRQLLPSSRHTKRRLQRSAWRQGD
jgi:hypothetical protein